MSYSLPAPALRDRWGARAPWLLSVAAAALALAGSAQAQSLLPAAFMPNNAGDTVSSYTVNPDGTLTHVGAFAAGDGPQAISLSPDGAILAVAHGTQSNTIEEVRLFQVNANATLTPLLTTFVPDSPLDILWLNNNVFAAPATSTATINNVSSYRYDRALNSVSTVDGFPTGTFASSLALAGPNRDVLLSDYGLFGGGGIMSHRFDATGDFTFVDDQGGAGSGVDLAATPDGRFAYAPGGINGAENELYGYGVGANGELSSLNGGAPFFLNGRAPAHVTVSDDGSTLFVGFNGVSNGTGIIRAYSIDAATGLITDTGNVFVAGDRSDIGPMGFLGNVNGMDLLFNWDNSTSTDGVRGLEVIRINPDGTMTGVGVFNPGVTMGNVGDVAVWRGIPEPGSLLALAGAGGLMLLRRRK